MASFGTPDEAAKIAADLVDYLAKNHPEAHPMQATGAVAMALGAMVASMSVNGITKEGRSGQLLKHLFAIAEAQAEEALSL